MSAAKVLTLHWERNCLQSTAWYETVNSEPVSTSFTLIVLIVTLQIGKRLFHFILYIRTKRKTCHYSSSGTFFFVFGVNHISYVESNLSLFLSLKSCLLILTKIFKGKSKRNSPGFPDQADHSLTIVWRHTNHTKFRIWSCHDQLGNHIWSRLGSAWNHTLVWLRLWLAWNHKWTRLWSACSHEWPRLWISWNHEWTKLWLSWNHIWPIL